ncbi:hypothetical protein [Kitasatospora sp. NPDC057500]|uniref:hypothetical protein n=1 Tax=Kitasatospora sp. NPDC057500 TaxID=3346151 RepID=UPI0036A98CC3
MPLPPVPAAADTLPFSGPVTGPEHYRFAQQRLLMAWEEDRSPENVAHLVAEAGVHATLALAAATALGSPATSGMDLADYDEWVQTSSETRTPAPAPSVPTRSLHDVLVDALLRYRHPYERSGPEHLATHLTDFLNAAGYKDAR